MLEERHLEISQLEVIYSFHHGNVEFYQKCLSEFKKFLEKQEQVTLYWFKGLVKTAPAQSLPSLCGISPSI